METSGINGSNGGANIFAAHRTKFGDNPFLQLLITQLRAQSPLDPLDNGSMMTQMSQLSSMEQQRELNDNLLNLLQFQGALARLTGLSQGSTMLGREVEYVVDDKGTKKTGLVTAVSVNESGEVELEIGGKKVPLSAVIGIKGSAKSGSGSGNKKGS